ncbi:MAG: CopD family protein [Actinomycetota bacterium]
MALLIALHVLAVVIWVGGMFFAYLVLRPSAGPLQAEMRLALWQRVFSRFFPLVWASVIVLLASGYGMLAGYFGFASAGLYINLMQGLGMVMVLLFLHLYFAPWRRFSASVERSDFIEAAKQLGQIRRIVGINLVLGLVTIIVGASGRFW